MRPRYLLILIALALTVGVFYVSKHGNPFAGGLAAEKVAAVAPTNGSEHEQDRPQRRKAATSTADPANATSAGSEHRERVPVVVAPVSQSDVPILLPGIGTVQAYYTVDAKALVDGVILNVNFQEGQDVKIGDPLVTIDPTPYQARVEQWQAARDRAKAQLENAKTNLWRDQQLLSHNFATQKQTDATQELVDQYTADIAEDEAQIKYAQYQLDNTVVRAEINGRTGVRHVDPGNLIRAADNTNLVTVVQMQPISVIITVPAKALAQAGISPGIVELKVFAYTQDGVTLLDTGTVQTVNNVVDPATGTIKLKANFPNERSKLWAGDFVDCKVVVETRHNGLTVPTAAIKEGPKGSFVWVVGRDGTAQPRGIVVKQTLGDTALIDRGLEAQEKVIVEGQFYLHAGVPVAVVPQLLANDSDVSEFDGSASKD
jgi:membrane fusion protein, multidrug efflux system